MGAELKAVLKKGFGPECALVHYQIESRIWYYDSSREYFEERLTDSMRDHEAGRRRELIESMQGELEVALTFAKVSSVAYGKGKLQRAIDARSRAEAMQSRAIGELVEAASSDPEASHTVRCKLAEVRHALAHLPSSGEPQRRARSAG